MEGSQVTLYTGYQQVVVQRRSWTWRFLSSSSDLNSNAHGEKIGRWGWLWPIGNEMVTCWRFCQNHCYPTLDALLQYLPKWWDIPEITVSKFRSFFWPSLRIEFFIVQQPAAKGTHDVSFKELIATAACRSCVHGYGDPIYRPFQRAKFQYLAFLLW